MSRELIENLAGKAGGMFKLTALAQKKLQRVTGAAEVPFEAGQGELIVTTLHEIADELDDGVQLESDAAGGRQSGDGASDSVEASAKARPLKKKALSAATKKAAQKKKTKKKTAKRKK